MLPTVGRLAALISVALMLSHSSAQSVTLYDITEDIPSGLPSQSVSFARSVSVSVGGTNSEGGTTYVEIIAETSLVVVEPSRTITFLSVPTTATVTFVEDASGFRGSAVIMGENTTQTGGETCGFGSDGRGTCLETLTGPSQTGVFTESGSVVPWYTLPATQRSAAQGSEVLGSTFKPLIVAAAVVTALIYA
ncbi:hypothetical protein MVEN_01626800 [Mycena venus]|uniref:Uncharacterized protein n=1 Tax=Mycena venus TaxID=2733690 RepID=A0A8H7CQM4_9AGAR|nr:hypothetical protein MVEN_01626800 [Mycena venus]